ncbi:Eukaryotic peptide chain release factor GTP-binding subunit ERF3A [Fasciolopsis buskii]|uniref:Eukaryotic peptide chain release factor GTP-binding subunit ERF3A n=1 Tax=Fasciolopsis buskii TaxID=27845 RepID=A0A8E0RSU4_9TREM|nr:Eukaryotic peptide chain release factor GTP-binding subunit ERF3A [Fasciolopsis buski]
MATWEDQAGSDSAFVSSFSNLDVNAPEFIPGQPFVYRSQPAPVALPSSNGDEVVVDEAPGPETQLEDMVDKRTLEKYEREAKEKNRETWYLSWALDTNAEEREKGKTVECGRAYFETEKKRFVLIDAPGHKSFVPNMITGAVVADLAILVISARRGEFECGFEKGGQTREHAVLVKTAGVKYLIVVVNKMDDPTVMWDQARYNECKDKIAPYLKNVGFNIKSEVFFMPCSGYTGAFLRDVPDESVCPWYRGPSLLELLDSLPGITRKTDGPLRIPISDKYKDMGIFVTGKIESGTVNRGQTILLLPNKISVEVAQLRLDLDSACDQATFLFKLTLLTNSSAEVTIWSAPQVFNGDVEVESAVAGETCKLRLKNVEEDDVTPGFCLCSVDNYCKVIVQ